MVFMTVCHDFRNLFFKYWRSCSENKRLHCMQRNRNLAFPRTYSPQIGHPFRVYTLSMAQVTSSAPKEKSATLKTYGLRFFMFTQLLNNKTLRSFL